MTVRDPRENFWIVLIAMFVLGASSLALLLPDSASIFAHILSMMKPWAAIAVLVLGLGGFTYGSLIATGDAKYILRSLGSGMVLVAIPFFTTSLVSEQRSYAGDVSAQIRGQHAAMDPARTELWTIRTARVGPFSGREQIINKRMATAQDIRRDELVQIRKAQNTASGMTFLLRDLPFMLGLASIGWGIYLWRRPKPGKSPQAAG